MGISNVAVKTFDSTGSQSLCRTNDYSGTEEVSSSFISRCKKMYISGTGETVIPGSLNKFPTSGSIDTFYINSDTDSISDMILNVEFKFSGSSVYQAYVSKDIILALINKIEIQVGHLTIQTLTSDDIYVRNLTELTTPCHLHGPLQENNTVSSELPVSHYTCASGDVIKIQASCSIPFTGRSDKMDTAFLQSGALTNSITVKVHYNNLYPTVAGSSVQVISGTAGTAGSQVTTKFLDETYFKSTIKTRTHVITSTEKNYIQKNIINRVLKTSSNVTQTIEKNTSVTSLTGDTVDFEIDLENITHNVSHLIIGLRLPHVDNKTLSRRTNSYDPSNQSSALTVDGVSTPFSEINPKSLFGGGTAHYDVFGYMPNSIDSIELVIGSDRTGFMSGSSTLITNAEGFGLLAINSKSLYLISLGESAFDTAGVPFSKTNNKKLIIKLNKDIFNKNGSSNAGNSLNDTTVSQKAIVSVTACGTKVQTIVGGSMSFS